MSSRSETSSIKQNVDKKYAKVIKVGHKEDRGYVLYVAQTSNKKWSDHTSIHISTCCVLLLLLLTPPSLIPLAYILTLTDIAIHVWRKTLTFNFSVDENSHFILYSNMQASF